MISTLTKAVAITLFLLGATTKVALAADLRSNASSWLTIFNTVPADTPKAERVQSIFRKIKRVTRGANLRTKLYIVDSDNEPWAVALQDSNIILSRGAIDIIYNDNDLNKGDARMAFVLGHELAHIVANDFWHQEVYHSFLESATTNTIDKQQQNRRKEQELRADEEGFIFASLAGYDTRRIFADADNQDDFLVQWAKQTNTVSGGNYYKPTERMSFLKQRLAKLDQAVELFKYGVKLAHFGRYEDAQILLDEFYKAYPSSQVLGNLGYVYIQTARRKMPPSLAYRYWYPTLLEYHSGVPAPSRSFADSVPEDAREDLITAVELLEAGAALDDTDIVLRINLVVAQLYLGNHKAAMSILAEAPSGLDDSPQLQALEALVMQENTESDQWNTDARKLFEQLASAENADENIVYNYAKLLDNRGRHGMANSYWKKLIAVLPDLPMSYQFIVCQRLAKQPTCKNPPNSSTATHPTNNVKVQHGEDVDAPQVKKILESWGDPITRNLGAIDTSIYLHPQGNSLLAIDGVIELISIKQTTLKLAQELKQELGPPLVDMPIGADRIWSYGPQWSALVRDGQVKEIWLAK